MLLAFIGERIVGAGSARALTGVGVVLHRRRRWPCARRAPAGAPRIAGRPSACCWRSTRSAPSPWCSTWRSRTCRRRCSASRSSATGPSWRRCWRRCGRRCGCSRRCRSSSASSATRRWRARRASRSRASATRSGRASGLAGAVVFAFALVYVGAERDKKVDLSYFRTAKPGEATRKIVASLDQPIQVVALLPAGERSARRGGGLLRRPQEGVEAARGQELRPRRRSAEGQGARRHRQRHRRRRRAAAHREQMSIGLELEGARAQLRNLDRDVQTRLLKVAQAAAQRLLRDRARRAHLRSRR